jgi:cation diffusion facilitator family transporter
MTTTPAPGQPADAAEAASREKRRVAATSVLAAVFLTGMKIAVGLATGSLGILSEAAHSGLDLVAAIVTWAAVRVSGRPADREHTYGHGKIENLSALFEVVLLLATCGWIVVEAVERLFVKVVQVEATPVAFLVMAASIVVDVSRSRALARVARKYSSQALEADALHFSTDVWSSAVVIVGLAGVYLSARPGLAWLLKADAVAAAGVAAIVVWVAYTLGRKTAADLLDEIPPGLRDDLEQAIRVPGVIELRRLRVRRSGPETFADVTLAVGNRTPLEQAHEIANDAEAAVRRVLPGADVVVHVEPMPSVQAEDSAALVATVRRLAGERGLAAHHIRVSEVLGARALELHLEVDGSLSVVEAHRQASDLENAVRAAAPDLEHIVTHLEPAGSLAPAQPVSPEEELHVLEVLHELARNPAFRCQPHDVSVQQAGPDLSLSFHCVVAPDTALAEAHLLTERVELALRERLPRLGHVTIHVEPQ